MVFDRGENQRVEVWIRPGSRRTFHDSPSDAPGMNESGYAHG
jgi:hypothetical protein